MNGCEFLENTDEIAATCQMTRLQRLRMETRLSGPLGMSEPSWPYLV